MTAKHRKGKNNQKQEDNFFKNETPEKEVRVVGGGGNNFSLSGLLVLFIMFVGASIAVWFCFQQHQTLTYLTDHLLGLQVKIGKLQSSHEDLLESKNKPAVPGELETRLTALEESHALTQKQVGMALATAEQLKTSDLPIQVESLHNEMKARLEEIQLATASLEQLGQLQNTLIEKNDAFEDVRVQVAGLATLNGELSEKVEVLSKSLGETETMLGEKFGQIVMLSNTLDGQTNEVLILKKQLDRYKALLETSIQEMAAVRELLANDESQELQQTSVEEPVNTLLEKTEALGQNEELFNATTEEEELLAAATDEEESVAAATEEEESVAAATEEEESVAAATEEEEEDSAAGNEEAEPATEIELKDELTPQEGEQEISASPEVEETAEGDEVPVEPEESVADEESADDGETEREEEEVEESHAEEGIEVLEEADKESEVDDENQGATDENETEKADDVTETEEEEQQENVANKEPQEADETLEDDASLEE